MNCYIGVNGYYEGDRASVLDSVVPQRPSSDYAWNGVAWVAPDPVVLQDAHAQQATDAISRLEFEIWFGQENRIRVLELKPAITRVQYRNALIAAWKTLNP